MKITREADYALRIVAMLAGGGHHMEAKHIAEMNDIPYRFTLKILRKIVQAGYLRSYRGANGGYALNKKPSEITMLNIIEVIDGPVAMNICLTDEGCKNSSKCNVRKKLVQIQKGLINELNSVTFADILEG